MGGDPLRAQDVFLILTLSTALCTLAGAWCSARSETGLGSHPAWVWLFLVATASAGISALVELLLLPIVAGFNAMTLLDTTLMLVVIVGAIRTWAGSLDQIDWTTPFNHEGDK